ncbi:uncharacterized protein J3D65DRAFT_364856 [Phyllosticta citribraziliensis]|uniref:Uncharacterized protein n=1 Tax=Phyllosticta citribraziliensis TaxID=989973 RepID=A0ABR1LSV0_9PEZI
MGCLPSRPSCPSKRTPPRAPPPNRCISPPIGGPIMVPSPQPEHNTSDPTLDPKLTRADLLHALDLASLHLDHHNEAPITIIALGGALHVLHLRSRLTTSALQFFHPDPASPQNAALAAAAAFAMPASGGQDRKSRTRNVPRLQPNWLTNAVILSLPLPLQSHLAAAACRQNDTIYVSHSGRLRVLAAPWEYVVASAVARMSWLGQRPWDMADAVAALRRWVGLRGGRPVKGVELLERAEDVYGVFVARETLRDVEGVYEAVWGVMGVVW